MTLFSVASPKAHFTVGQLLVFREALKKARDFIKSGGDTGCYGVKHCWHCAMRHHAGPGVRAVKGYSLFDAENNAMRFPNDWSFSRTREETVALFDNSIADIDKRIRKMQGIA